MSPPPPGAHLVGDAPPLRWGIMSCGRISTDFVLALKVTPGASVVAVAAARPGAAAEFAQRLELEADRCRSYTSYDDLARDPNVDCVYIGGLHTLHRKQTLMCIEQGKHVLCEKPLAVHASEAREMVDAARSRGVFLMEGMWTRCFPAVRHARKLIEQGAIGRVRQCYADFGFRADPDPEGTSRLFDPKQGGGACLDIGCYPLGAASLAFGGVPATSVRATGELAHTGVDLSAAVALAYRGGGTAAVSFTLSARTPEETVIVGEEGTIRILGPAHTPTQLAVTRAGDSAAEIHDFPLPEPPELGRRLGLPSDGFYYGGSVGFAYEAAEVACCIVAGKTESPAWPNDEALQVQGQMGEILSQLGVEHP